MDKKKLLIPLFIYLLSFQHQAQALAMHELQLNSSINQPLNAVIRLTANAEEINSLNLAISRLKDSDLSSHWPEIQADLIKQEKGKSYIQITSKNVIREPIIGFILELNWSNGKILREYSLLIDLH